MAGWPRGSMTAHPYGRCRSSWAGMTGSDSVPWLLDWAVIPPDLCVRDRVARTVAFTIDGHCPGIAFADVPDGDLFFACVFLDKNDSVEIAA